MIHAGSIRSFLFTAALLTAGVAFTACNDDDNEGENTGDACMSADECYPDVDHAELAGTVECMDRVEDGYCTHLCVTDEDCCAAEGECETGIPQVCAPFESLPDHRCFLSCEDEVIGDWDSNEYCQEYAHPAFGCRSTGGGSENRKVCLP